MLTLTLAIVRALGISTSLTADLSFHKPCQALGVICPDTQRAAITKMHDHAISAPKVPHPAAPDTHVNSQAIEK